MINSLNQQIFFRLKLLTSSWKITDNFTGNIEYQNGSKQWFLNGVLHRTNKPAFEHFGGSKFWYLNGKYHRENGPAIEYAKRHRENEPAVDQVDGTKYWFLNGKKHRIDGPAVERPNGDKSWYLNDKFYSEKNWQKEVQKMNEK